MGTNKKPMSKKQITAELWKRGDLTYLLNPAQIKMHDAFEKDERIIVPILASRRTGKTFYLLVRSFMTCIKQERAVVKFLQPTQKELKKTIRGIMPILMQDCPEALKPEWKENEKIWLFPNGSEIQLAGSDAKQYENLRGGCFTGDSPIMTPNGPVNIIDINVGDEVYGYNKDGSTSITTVKNKFYNGIQKVTEFKKGPNVLGACTDNHRWLTQTTSSYYRKDGAIKERSFAEINDRMYIRRDLPIIETGIVDEPDAYLIGAFIGDGCCTSNGNMLNFATKDIEMAEHISSHLGVKFKDRIENNYTVHFCSTLERYKHSDVISFNYYNEWLKGKHFHDKNFDYDIVDTWNRDSVLKLLAGLLDTDGNVYFNKSGLELTFNHSNLPLIENIKKILFKLFQVRARIKHDNRDKYTSNHYKLIVRSSYMIKRILLEMEDFIVLDRKKWKEEYNDLRNDEKREVFKITKGNSWYDHTYDLEVDNETHLYLTADGLITHNSSNLCIVDEAGFCDDLEDAVYSVLEPTTATTDGRLFLASTPSKLPTHDFMRLFIEPALEEGKLLIFTIDDNTMISEKRKLRIIENYPGGVDNPKYRREYRCEIIRDQESVVIPEFTDEAKKEIVGEFPRPVYCDSYVSGDVGFRDLTVILFGYYDFKTATIVIEDELVMNGPSMTTESLAANIKKCETRIFKNEFDEQIVPYRRVMDNNNLILINDLSRLHDLNFTATAKDNKEAQINQVRMYIEQRRVKIHPRCKHLTYHLASASWDKNHKKFLHLPNIDNDTIKGGHADALDAFIYLVRNIITSHNPFPINYGRNDYDSYMSIKKQEETSGVLTSIKKMLNIK